MKVRSIILIGFMCLGISLRAYDQFDVQDMLYRIDKCITLLDQFNKKNKNLQNLTFTKTPLCPDNTCEHELVKLCLKKMACEGEVFSPIVETWMLFKQSFNSVEKDLFAREFAVVLCAVFEHTLQILTLRAGEPSGSIKQQVSLVDIITLYNKISALPIVQVIESLEQLYSALKELMEEYGITADTSWSTWITTNWWVPPVVIGSLAYTILNRSIVKKVVVADVDRK